MKRAAIDLLIIVIASVVVIIALDAWLAARGKEKQLQLALASQQKVIADANKRESEQNETLKKALADIEKIKAKNRTPSQILKNLPTYLALPQPLRTEPTTSASTAVENLRDTLRGGSDEANQFGTGFNGSQSPGSQRELAGDPHSGSQPKDHEPAITADGKAPSVQLPSEDLKPLFDSVQDCRACQAELAAAYKNASDDAAKLDALTHQRDAALAAARGGTLWHRLVSNLRWFAVGAAGGYVVSRLWAIEGKH